METRQKRKWHRVQILDPPQGRGDRNELTGDWQIKETLSATIKPLRGRQLEQARQLTSTATHEFEMWQHNGFELTPKNRLRMNGRVFDIGYVRDPDEDGLKWRVICTEEIKDHE